MLFVCYAKCGTCKKAEKYLQSKNVTLEKRDIKEDSLLWQNYRLGIELVPYR